MNTPKYQPNQILFDLMVHDVDMQVFTAKVKSMSGGVITQSMFEFIYETLVVNNYNCAILSIATNTESNEEQE